jgi:hypothetical protein
LKRFFSKVLPMLLRYAYWSVIIASRKTDKTLSVPRKASCKRAMEDDKTKEIDERHLEGNCEDP